MALKFGKQTELYVEQLASKTSMYPDFDQRISTTLLQTFRKVERQH